MKPLDRERVVEEVGLFQLLMDAGVTLEEAALTLDDVGLLDLQAYVEENFNTKEY